MLATLGIILAIVGCGIGYIGKAFLKSYSIEHFGDMVGGIGMLMIFASLIFG